MVSIIIPSVRDYRWKNIIENFSSTKTDYEIIVCGPCNPVDLGPHFRAIQTNVKATQCIEIAVRQSRGEYLFFASDDTDSSTNMLDVFITHRLSYGEDLVILSPTFKQLGKPFPPEAHRFPSSTGKYSPGTPTIPIGMFISRKDWDTIGGIDKNFVKGFWDLDVAIRCWALGGKVIVLSDVFINEILPDLPHTAAANVNASHHKDLPYLWSLWTDTPVLVDGKININRLKHFEPFSDENILEIDQGVPDTNKGISQNFDTVLSEYIRTGKSKGCRDLFGK
jgi:hypothetical protein